jgi:hypothetical protein
VMEWGGVRIDVNPAGSETMPPTALLGANHNPMICQ